MITLKTIPLAIVAVASLAAGDVRAEPDYMRVDPLRDPAAFLRLRPLKEPAPCVTTANCPLVASPRINKRLSTIPGTSNPDYGRPPVPTLLPPAGGNRGITD